MIVAACKCQSDVDLMAGRTDQALAADRATAEPFVQTLHRQRSSADLKKADAPEAEAAPRPKPRSEQKTDKPDEVETADETTAADSSADVSQDSEVASDAEPIVQDQDQNVEQDDGLTDEELAAAAVNQQQVQIADPSQAGTTVAVAITAEAVDGTQNAAATQTAAPVQSSEQTLAASKQVDTTSQAAAGNATESPLALQATGTGTQVATSDSSTDDSASQLPAQPRPAPQPQHPAPAPHATQPSEQPAAPTQTTTTVNVATPVTDVAAAPASAMSGPAVTESQPASNQPSTVQDDSLNAARLARGLNNAVNQRGGAVTLRLTPPDMGTVRIQMQITGTQVSVRFHAETEQGQAMLTQNLGQLRQTLEGQGLQVDRISVQTMQPNQSASSNHTGTQQDQQRTDSQQQQTRADDGRSRGSFDRRQDDNDGGRRQRDDQSFDFQQMLREGNTR